MSTHEPADGTYGVRSDERIQLLLEEDIEQTRRLADAVERLNENLEAREEATTQ